MRRAVAARIAVATTVVMALMILMEPATVGMRRVAAADGLAGEVEAAADKALAFMRGIATNGGWVWRYSLDMRSRAGESRATPTMIWVQPPGTPAVGMALVRAYAATGDRKWLDAAKEAADALAAGQLESGGWDYSIDFDPAAAARVRRRSDGGPPHDVTEQKRFDTTTFDDDTTQSAVRFLLAVVASDPAGDAPRDRRIRAACDHALAKMLEAQYPNGAWPQRYDGRARDPADWPVRRAEIHDDWPREWTKRDYSSAYTLNDGVLRDCVGVMLDAFRRRGEARFRDAALRAGTFVVLAQLPAPQAAWAQQYDREMRPTWARAFEPPAVTAGESVTAVRTLLDLFHETGDRRWLEPIPAAIDWWRRSEIAPGRWARFYELGTNRPIYGDRDGRIHASLEEISAERRTGYGWQGDFGVAGIIQAYERAVADGPRPVPEDRPRKPKETRVREVLAALDEQGRWVTRGAAATQAEGLEFGDRIETARFIENLDVLTAYLAAHRMSDAKR